MPNIIFNVLVNVDGVMQLMACSLWLKFRLKFQFNTLTWLQHVVLTIKLYDYGTCSLKEITWFRNPISHDLLTLAIRWCSHKTSLIKFRQAGLILVFFILVLVALKPSFVTGYNSDHPRFDHLNFVYRRPEALLGGVYMEEGQPSW